MFRLGYLRLQYLLSRKFAYQWDSPDSKTWRRLKVCRLQSFDLIQFLLCQCEIFERGCQKSQNQSFDECGQKQNIWKGGTEWWTGHGRKRSSLFLWCHYRCGHFKSILLAFWWWSLVPTSKKQSWAQNNIPTLLYSPWEKYWCQKSFKSQKSSIGGVLMCINIVN